MSGALLRGGQLAIGGLKPDTRSEAACNAGCGQFGQLGRSVRRDVHPRGQASQRVQFGLTGGGHGFLEQAVRVGTRVMHTRSRQDVVELGEQRIAP